MSRKIKTSRRGFLKGVAVSTATGCSIYAVTY
ncbi:MAG: twin-arginine translocation signal domain-containing protein [Microcoleus sp. SIO2G3]|nr:twin-arginine translocation signal domain-containing protein [Microcoleus sp. SIO2G3]